jgi:hypothetical protein
MIALVGDSLHCSPCGTVPLGEVDYEYKARMRTLDGALAAS